VPASASPAASSPLVAAPRVLLLVPCNTDAETVPGFRSHRLSSTLSVAGDAAAEIAHYVERDLPCQACPNERLQASSWTLHVEHVNDVVDVAEHGLTGDLGPILAAS